MENCCCVALPSPGCVIYPGTDSSIVASKPSIFGNSDALFGTSIFGAQEQPLVRTTLTGSGFSNLFKIFSDDRKAPYTINGLYVRYRPSGRQG